MESPPDQSPQQLPAHALSPSLEVVILDGRQPGARRPLHSPLTIIGRAEHCDIRLNAEGVEPVHCALVMTPIGPLLRGLQKPGVTYVNDEPTATCHLRTDDVVKVGPFQFQVLWSATPAPLQAKEALREKEALRIQAAAVVAQQSSLTEEEIRLQQRRQALEQQEKQLAALLDEKQIRLAVLRDEARKAHAALREDRAAFEKRVAGVMNELSQSRQEVADAYQQNLVERDRLLKLRHNLKRRWHRQWAAERASMRRREAELARARTNLQAERGRHQDEVARTTAKLLRFNAEMELGRRHLRADRDLLRQRHGELQILARSLDQREAGLLQAEQGLAQTKQQWETTRDQRRREMEGLENRVANQRQKMEERQKEADRLEAKLRELNGNLHAAARQPALPDSSSQPMSSVPAGTEKTDLLQQDWQIRQTEAVLQTQATNLGRVAAELADQRLYLAEKFEHFARACHRWEQERVEIAAELEALGHHLQQQEQMLLAREQSVRTGEHELRRRRHEIALQERRLEARKARIASEASAWQTEREQIRAELREKDNVLKERLHLLSELRDRWFERRQKQIAWLRNKRSACEELRRQGIAVQEEYQRGQAALLVDRRKVAEQALALEQYRLECVSKAADPVVADKRLEVLRQRWTELSAAAEKATAQERRELEAERRRLTEEFSRLQAREEQCASLERDLLSRQAASEEKQVLSEQAQADLQQQLCSLRTHGARYEKRLQELRDEVERLARLLLDEADVAPMPQGQAA